MQIIVCGQPAFNALFFSEDTCEMSFSLSEQFELHPEDYPKLLECFTDTFENNKMELHCVLSALPLYSLTTNKLPENWDAAMFFVSI